MVIASPLPETVSETCDDETFSARCPYSQVIIITNAQYGHIALGKCLTADLGHFGCSADISSVVKRSCDGKQRCQVEESDPAIRKTKQQEPCLQLLAVYMEITYACIPGEYETILQNDFAIVDPLKRIPEHAQHNQDAIYLCQNAEFRGVSLCTIITTSPACMFKSSSGPLEALSNVSTLRFPGRCTEMLHAVYVGAREDM